MTVLAQNVQVEHSPLNDFSVLPSINQAILSDAYKLNGQSLSI